MCKKLFFILQIVIFLMMPFLMYEEASAEKINIALGGNALKTMDPTVHSGGSQASYYNVH